MTLGQTVGKLETEIARLRAALEQALEARPEDVEGILRKALAEQKE